MTCGSGPSAARSCCGSRTRSATAATGPLEIFAERRRRSDCDGDGDPDNDRDATQRIFADSNGSGGSTSAGADAVASERRFGCMRYHPAHDHWHVLDFARYELRREPQRRARRCARARSASASSTRAPAFAERRRRRARPTYPINPPGRSAAASRCSTQGISAGLGRRLRARPARASSSTSPSLPRGRYCLTTRADPTGLLDELDEANNVRRVRLGAAARASRACASSPGACRA